MDREIKFRGKHIHVFSKNKKLDGQWVYGYYCDENYIRTDNAEKLIDKNTLGQFTGVKDINGKEIYEGDIIEISTGIDKKNKAIVEFDCYGFFINSINDTDVCYLGELDIDIDTFIEVIGNVYDNPELLES